MIYSWERSYRVYLHSFYFGVDSRAAWYFDQSICASLDMRFYLIVIPKEQLSKIEGLEAKLSRGYCAILKFSAIWKKSLEERNKSQLSVSNVLRYRRLPKVADLFLSRLVTLIWRRRIG